LESYLLYLISRLTLSAIRLLPRSSALQVLNALASLTYRVDRVHRRIAHANLNIAFPELSDKEHQRIARASFQQTARNLLEISHLPELTRDEIPDLVQYDPEYGLNQYERARSGGKGVLFLTGHFSAWELLPAAHALYGHPLSFVTRPLDNAPLERYLRKARESAGNTVIYKKNSVRHILSKLKAGGDVGILMDQNTFLQEGVFANLFGMPAATSTSVALLALRTECPVIPGYLTPGADGRYTIKFLPPVELVRSGDTIHDIRVNTQLFNQILEGIIRQQPETWLWGHMRWKYRPEGTPDLYRLSLADLRTYVAQNAGKNH
jgi:Kdo2-lipid IVA lauroyltransferase/acyltransferase